MKFDIYLSETIDLMQKKFVFRPMSSYVPVEFNSPFKTSTLLSFSNNDDVISIWQSNNKSLLAVYVMALLCNNFQRDNHSIYAMNNIIFISYDYQCLCTHNVFINHH